MLFKGFVPLAALAALVACGHTSAPAGPAGFTRVSQTTWVKGRAAAQQRYVLNKTPFLGSLRSLASRTTVSIVLKNPGVRFVRSVPLAACPAAAAIATYRLTKGMLDEAFAVRDGNAITIAYRRPLAERTDPAVITAITHRLCRTPL